MFGKLEISDLKAIKEYLDSYDSETIYFKGPIEAFEEGKLEGHLFGYMEDHHLLGLFYFSNKNSMMIHLSDAKVLGNLNVLKAIKHYKPKYIKGNQSSVDGIYKIICRTVKDIKEDIAILMAYSDVTIEVTKSESYRFIERLSQGDMGLLNDLKFFMHVEKTFGRNVLTVKDLQHKIKDMINQNNYCLVLDNDHFIGQGLIEEESSHTGVIGGIYVEDKYRHKGIGQTLTQLLTHRLIERQKTPYLFVLKNNIGAINLYEKIGYKQCEVYAVLTVSFE